MPPTIHPASRPPVLVAMADYYGTLAAVRCLGRAGIAVTVAEWRRLIPARWSRYATRRIRCPDVTREPAAFLDWLLRLGAREPGHVLLATSDDLAWLYARHREELARSFRLYLPDFGAMHALLGKPRLYQACRAVGIDVPATWVPESDAELVRVAREATYPLIVKPQSQVLLARHVKGDVVWSAEELTVRYAALRATIRFPPAVVEIDPTVALPMVQELADGRRGVYSVSGFLDETGRHVAYGASRKILQRPRRAGVGICFEADEVVRRVAEQVIALCRHVGYHGVFEAEFVEDGDRHLLIDFNPRFYGQMALDIDRGLPLPLLAYLGALGDVAALETAVDAAGRRNGSGVYCSRIQLAAFCLLLGLTGRGGEARGWRRWLAHHRDDLTDPVIVPGDHVPGLIETIAMLMDLARHPRSALRDAR